jgi:hypothetical protein
MIQEELVPVWPFEEGDRRSYTFLPLHKRAPQAALKDWELYQLLPWVDALRGGSPKERELANRELGVRQHDRQIWQI